MSIISRKTTMSSILRKYSATDRDKSKITSINKVRFSMQKDVTIKDVIEGVLERNEIEQYEDFVLSLQEGDLNDKQFLKIVSEAKSSIQLLTADFIRLVQSLLSLNWLDRDCDVVKEYTDFYVDLLVAHPSYTEYGISKLISYWVGDDKGFNFDWTDTPKKCPARERLAVTHKLLSRILSVIPMSFDVLLDCVSRTFPYFKKSTTVVASYIQNMLDLQERNPSLTSHFITLIVERMVLIDVNAPRNEILDAEMEVEIAKTETVAEEVEIEEEDLTMKHQLAETLDVCMHIMFDFIDKVLNPPDKSSKSKNMETLYYFKMFSTIFDDIILHSHNTHHVQFLIFYLCSLKGTLAEQFLENLWHKVTNPNLPAAIRQAATGYLSGFLARSKFIPEWLLKDYLTSLCSFAHNYIQRCDSVISNSSLKANIVFYSVCQAVFYIIAFRSRDLTNDKKNLMFLQSLQLSGIVSCNLNPLRVCLPDVATAFASVTRSHQLAYCHTILERNARRRLATIYDNDMGKPQEILDTFFPFDPYLLKKSCKRITPIYLQYHFTESDERIPHSHSRKRTESFAQVMDDIDDFIVDKKMRMSESDACHEKELQFNNYKLSSYVKN